MEPKITIVTTTYYPEGADERFSMAHIAIVSWEEHLFYNGELALHVADDGSILDIKPSFLGDISNTRQERKGVGASLNAGFQKAFEESPLAMYIVDDWILHEPIDLNPWAQMLVERQEIGMVRLGPPHPNLRGTIKNYPQGWAFLLDRYGFAYGMRPALYHKRFFDAYGWFDEGESAVECERHFNERFSRTSESKPDIVHAIFSPWEHRRVLDLGEIEP